MCQWRQRVKPINSQGQDGKLICIIDGIHKAQTPAAK